jgi:hypothetical protein
MNSCQNSRCCEYRAKPGKTNPNVVGKPIYDRLYLLYCPKDRISALGTEMTMGLPQQWIFIPANWHTGKRLLTLSASAAVASTECKPAAAT